MKKLLILMPIILILSMFLFQTKPVRSGGNPCTPPPKGCRCFFDRTDQTCLCLCRVPE